MTTLNVRLRNGYRRLYLLAVLLTVLAGGLLTAWPKPPQPPLTITGYFSSAVGLYPGDDVEILGVPVGSVTSIKPGPEHSEITFTIRPDVPVPAAPPRSLWHQTYCQRAASNWHRSTQTDPNSPTTPPFPPIAPPFPLNGMTSKMN